MSSNKVFVGGLEWALTEDDLAEEFGRVGEVKSAKVITDRETGRSRGFGFVEFVDPESVEASITALDQRELNGRTIRVSVAEDRR